MKTLYNFLALMLLIPFLGMSQNSGLRFDGSDEKVSIPFKSDLNPTDNYTVEAWIYAENWKALSWQGSLFTNDGQGPDRGFAFRCGENGKLSFVLSVGNQWNEVISPALMNTKQWHHVAAVVDNGNLLLYVDGLEVASSTYSGNITPSDGAFTIGESTGFNGRFFEGVLDEIRIWNVVRTPSQIADNTTVDLTGTESGLVAYFPMNDGSGTTVTNIVDPSCSATTLQMDDSNWVEGYTLPDFDVSVKNISNIDGLLMKNRPSKIKFDVQNVGTTAIADVTAIVSVDGVTIGEEIITETIQPGAALNYCFITPVDLQGINNPNITVTISHPEDANSLNNETELDFVTRSGTRVNLFDRSQHNFGAQGQTQSAAVRLPGDLSKYNQLLLHISVSCPSTGCDDWDQTATVIARTDAGVFEIARYITPYGIACGPWVVDVTDFKSILSGEVLYDSFVQVFGQSGWLVTIDLELIEGDSPLPHSHLTPIHQQDYHVYGDPGINDDLAPVSVTLADNTESSHLRMHMSGHGQGNTSNAAEFFNVTHQVTVDGVKLADHILWKNDCNANPCANQAGNWVSPRAGWCPGQEVIPAVFNTTGALGAGQTSELDYQLQAYTNMLNTGYNSSGHTEPHYRIHSVFVENSSTAFRDYNNIATTSLNFSPATGVADQLTATLTNDGNQIIAGYQAKLYVDGELIDTQDINEELAVGASRTIEFNVDFSSINNANFIVEACAAGDQSPGDDLLGQFYQGMVSTEDLLVGTAFSVSPNPTTGLIHLEFEETLLESNLMIYSFDGQLIERHFVNQQSMQVDILQAGSYLVKVIDKNGHSSSKKIIVIK